MTAPEITIATPTDRAAVVETLVAAFVKDPVLRSLFPDEETYPRYAATFFGHLFDKRVQLSSIWTIGGGASVAIWEPPAGQPADPPAPGHGSPDEARYPADVLARVESYNETVHAALPTFPFWYLGVLGTHPESAGRGWGRAVMRAGLERAAADGLPAILETSNPGNIELYRRAGWEVVGSLAEPVPTWIMQQPPRRAL
ncbi:MULTISPECIES: N-acetyltransferase [Micromonospora]|uniref:Ribosomal protein S18 acetylase RimI-like enzyme n=1 Tax=Micromonospora vinacea TaxID=709878 RepID=A0ABS0JUC9_9ACTN|nr:GNAT family N-acetyltransferase [Micromonospora vinacea]MBG6099781.1 ribosomal protein S18 acetylase RimI-like enzyme [Micromonospora vinacea]WSZ77234.1 GNAT family N-acetyltransferase [Micromonospora sp. NBC_00860]WTA66277.1 GNAT family N-acetyltransferase [Micromonospora sp. NBC_00855]